MNRSPSLMNDLCDLKNVFRFDRRASVFLILKKIRGKILLAFNQHDRVTEESIFIEK